MPDMRTSSANSSTARLGGNDRHPLPILVVAQTPLEPHSAAMARLPRDQGPQETAHAPSALHSSSATVFSPP